MQTVAEQAPSGNRGRVHVFEADPERAASLVSQLDFLNYKAILPAAKRNGARVDDEAGIAAVVGSIGASKPLQQALASLTASRPGMPIIVISDASSRDEFDLSEHPVWRIGHPIRCSEVSRLLDRARRYSGVERRHRISGKAPSISEVRQQIEQVADFDTTVLITGESGTGKELVARTIHDLSDRADKPFVPINCGAIPEELLESELFGHKKGAFTGAVSERTGRFELAEGGTLFLDEIGDMCLAMQVKLLRVLQERCFERVGSNRTQRCDVRIVAATHCDLPAAVANGEFREDLYYRINVFPIQMPCLKKRVSDLPALFEELLLHHHGSDAALRLSAEALQALSHYSWPGNIRELSNLVERLGIMKPTGEVRLEDLPASIRDARPAKSPAQPIPSGVDLRSHLKKIEHDLIQQAMESTGGVTARAARMLGMQRTTLVEKLARLAL